VAGALGDVIDLTSIASRFGPASADVFASGHVRLTARGADTVLEADGDGPANNGSVYTAVLVLEGVSPGALTADNFAGGITPQVGGNGSVPSVQSKTVLFVEDDALVSLNIAAPADADGGAVTIRLEPSSVQGGTFRLPDGSTFYSWQAADLSVAQLTGLAFVPDPQASGDLGALRYRVADEEGSVAHGFIRLMATPVNDPPSLSDVSPGFIDDGTSALNLDLDHYTSDPDGAQGRTYAFTPVDGGALPAWLAYDADTHVLSGTAPLNEGRAFTLLVTVTDEAGVSDTGTFTFAPSGRNLYGGDGPDTLAGFSGNDQLAGYGGDDVLSGMRGDDWFRGYAGDDTLRGGEGIDTAYFNGYRADFSVSRGTNPGEVIVSHSLTEGEGTDLLIGVEQLQFWDGSVSVQDALPPEPAPLEVLAYAWKSHDVLPGAVVSLGSAGSQTADSSGVAGFAAVAPGAMAVTASRAVPALEAGATAAAVTLQDAVAILKMIANQPVNAPGRALSPYQALAADFDGNGAVSLADALGVLRHAVGLSAAAAPHWAFVDEADAGMPSRATTNPGLVPATLSGVTPVDGHMGLVGVLRGDVDGSWQAPAGTPRLGDEYFTALEQRLDAQHPSAGFELSQWGVYPG